MTPLTPASAQFEALLKWLNKNGVRERKLLKKLQKSKVRAQPNLRRRLTCVHRTIC